MDQAPQVEIVDLGDAKEQTKGEINQPLFENHPTLDSRQMD